MSDKLWVLVDHVVNTLYKKNIPIIWSYQNAARINKPYIVLDYTTADVPNFDNISNEIDENGIRVRSSWRKIIADMQIYDAHDSMPLANFISMALETEASLAKQWELDCSIGNRLLFQRIPALLNESQYEDRAIYQFDFFYTELFDEDVGLIETVILQGKYLGGYGETQSPPSFVECKEIISIHSQTKWDDGNTYFDSVTVWDGMKVEFPLTVWDATWDDLGTFWDYNY